MNRYFLLAFLLASGLSCKIQPGSNRHYADGDERKVFKLILNPGQGSKYHYDVANETEIRLEVNDKKIDNLTRSQIGVYYEMNKDSAGDIVFNILYDRIRLYTKKNDEETNMDAANAATTEDPAEKMLGALTAAPIIAIISPAGVVKSVNGYKEMTDKIMAGFNNNDENTRRIARTRVEQFIGNGIVRKNMDQLFKIFPDSAVHVGDKWKLSSQEKGELNLTARGSFALASIDDGLALIRSEGELTSDSAETNLMGTNVTTHLKGTQQGEYEMNTHTGMLESASITANMEGMIDVMGREIPVTIKMKVKMTGRKLK